MHNLHSKSFNSTQTNIIAEQVIILVIISKYQSLNRFANSENELPI